VAVSGEIAAVINFGSTNVTVFVRHGDAMHLPVVKTASQPGIGRVRTTAIWWYWS